MKLSRYQKKQIERAKKRFKKFVQKMLKQLLKYILLFILGVITFIICIFSFIEQSFYKVCKRLPRRVKLTIFVLMLVYSYIGISNMNVTIPDNVYNFKKIVVNKIVPKVEAEEEVVEDEPEEVYYCNYGETECKIMEIAIANGLTRDQAKIIIAISKAECGKNYTSWYFVNNNNPGGLFFNGKFMKFETIEDGIQQMVKDLKIGYFDKGLDTIEKIQKKWAPVGADNDPNNLNSNWVSNVTDFYNSLDK